MRPRAEVVQPVYDATGLWYVACMHYNGGESLSFEGKLGRLYKRRFCCREVWSALSYGWSDRQDSVVSLMFAFPPAPIINLRGASLCCP